MKATSDAAVVFINERFASPSGSARESVLPGTYRVFCRSQEASRVHHAVVTKARRRSSRSIPTRPARAQRARVDGLAFPTTEARDKQESMFAAYLASGISAKGVIVVGIENVRSKPSVVASPGAAERHRENPARERAARSDPSVDRPARSVGSPVATTCRRASSSTSQAI